MSKELYEEALADVKRLQEVAEDNAKRALVEAVTPRIRDLIEKELLRESDEDSLDNEMGDIDVPVSSVPGVGDSESVASGMSTPDEEGKVTLDLDSLSTDPAGVAVSPPMFGEPAITDEYELSLESINALTPVMNATKSFTSKELEVGLYRLGENIKQFSSAGKLVKESRGYFDEISRMISRVENMYDYVQESITDSRKKSAYESKLETYFQELTMLQERKMSKKSLKDLMNEGDVTLKLTGLPDDIDLDSVGVDLVTGGGEEGDDLEGGDEDLDLSGDDEAGDDEGDDEGGDLDLDDLDLGGDDQGDDTQMESRRLSDDTIVEIDEGMLRREISRMKKLREEAVPSTKGAGANAVLDAFGGGKGEGDAFLDGDVTTESDGADLEEADMMDEVDGDLTMDEVDDLEEMDQAQDQRSSGGNVAGKGNPGAATNKQSRELGQTLESVKRRVSFEKRLQERIKARAAALKTEAVRASAKKDSRKLATLKNENVTLRKRFVESMKRETNLMKTLTEAKANKGFTMNGKSTQPAETLAERTLRTKLTETNLFNAKLVYTNKLLQNETLSKKQKAAVIQRLEEANTLREVKLVYESLSKTLAGTSRSLTESTDRKVIGSSSRATRPASTSLNEGYETDRWARLAGINK